MAFLQHYNLKLPDEAALFTVPEQGIRRRDASSLVYDVALGTGSSFPSAYLRHYSFFDRWFSVNVSLDADGRFLTETCYRTGFGFTFNCDIATPMTREATDTVARVDLELDVLAASDGRAFLVKDEEDFARSVAAGWITPGEAEGAREGLASLLAIVQTTGLIPFLETICAFASPDELRCLPPQPPVTLLHRSAVPAFARRMIG